MRLRSHVRVVRRRLAAVVATVGAMAALAAPCAPAFGAEPLAGEAAHEVRDPHYGDVLFHFYQAHYFTALTTLMASQHFDRVAHHADEAEVLRGGMLLSYGMHREAGAIFTRLIEQGATPAVRDRAWFYLAKIRYQRGDAAQAEAALARIEQRLPLALEEERGLLQANLLMARADYTGAANVLGALNDQAAGSRYVRFNLGIALIKGGDAARGTAMLDALGRAPAENEEYRSLRDRANVALGFAALRDQRPQDARVDLERVRLNGLQANKALLGFGWAAAALKEPRLALVPWLELAQRDPGDSAALEARIAVPYAYAELGAYRQSLTLYNDAIAAYARENTDLDESIAVIRSGTLVQALIERNPGDEMGWFQGLHDLPELPHAGHLAQVLASNEFQEAFKNYRDLRFLARNLEEWRDKLGVFDDMLATRRKAYAERLPQVRDRASGIGLPAMRQRRDALAAELARAQASADGVAFADAKQRGLLARIARARATLDADASNPELAPARARVRLAAGALGWQLAQDHPARLWAATRQLQVIDATLAQAQQRDAALVQAQRDEPARFEQFAQRIAALRPRLQAEIPRVAALEREQQAALQEIAVAALVRQKERLVAYSTQARYAVAQLYDRANEATDARPDVRTKVPTDAPTSAPPAGLTTAPTTATTQERTDANQDADHAGKP